MTQAEQCAWNIARGADPDEERRIVKRETLVPGRTPERNQWTHVWEFEDGSVFDPQTNEVYDRTFVMRDITG